MACSQKRKCEIVYEPDFLESYSKKPWTNLLLFSPMILIEFLFAPTVPSEPIPKKIPLKLFGFELTKFGS